MLFKKKIKKNKLMLFEKIIESFMYSCIELAVANSMIISTEDLFWNIFQYGYDKDFYSEWSRNKNCIGNLEKWALVLLLPLSTCVPLDN